jgi:AcrR family transcriptional regulator
MKKNNVMTPNERRERERDAARARILDAAREVFVELGFEATTMRRVAQRAGYTTGALVHHFRDKESLLMALCAADFLSLRREFDRIARIENSVARLRELCRSYVGFARKYPNHYQLMFMTIHPNTPVEERGIVKGNPDEDAYAFLRQTVEAARQAGKFRPEYDDADLLAQVLWSGIHGVIALEMTHGQDVWTAWRPFDERARVMSEALLRGLMRPEEG